MSGRDAYRELGNTHTQRTIWDRLDSILTAVAKTLRVVVLPIGIVVCMVAVLVATWPEKTKEASGGGAGLPPEISLPVETTTPNSVAFEAQPVTSPQGTTPPETTPPETTPPTAPPTSVPAPKPTTTAPRATPATRVPATPAPKPPSGPFTVNDTDIGSGLNQVQYSGNFRVQGSCRVSDQVGASYSMTFRGTAVTLFSAKDSNFGKAAVKVDDFPSVTVDFFAANRAQNVEIFRRGGLSNGNHKITVTALGTSSPGSSGSAIALDRFVVTP